MSVRVICNRCENIAVIHSSNIESTDLKTLYCLCSNPFCGHTLVTHMSFSHTLSPSALDIPAQGKNSGGNPPCK